MSPEFKHFERPTSTRPSSLVSVVVVSAVVGLAMGAAGFTAMQALYPSEPLIYGSGGLGYTISRKPIDEPLAGLALQLESYVGSLYRREASLEPLFLDASFLGSVTVVTSDGWFLYAGDARVARFGATTIIFNNKEYSVADVRYDARSGVSFLKVDASSLNPVVFYRDGYPTVGSVAVSYELQPGVSSQIQRTMIERSNVVSRPTKAGLSANSIELRGTLEISEPTINSLLFNLQGQLVAITADKESPVIPAYYLEQSLLAILSDRQPANLGVSYQELYREPLSEQKGALVTARPAAISVASKAGLLLNDRIVAIDGKDLSLDYTFPQAQARYFTGDTAVIKIERGDQTLDLEVSF